VGKGSISLVIPAGVEPAAVLWVDKETLAWADILILWYGEDFRGSIAGRGLGRPDANLPPVVKNKTIGTAVLEYGVVVLVLVELYAPIKPGTILGVPVVALARALQQSFRILSDGLNLSLSVHNPDDPVGGHPEAVRLRDRDVGTGCS